MFGLFKRKNKISSPNYQVFGSEVEKYRFITGEVKEGEGQYVLIYHFDDTGNEMEQLFNAAGVSFSKDNSPGNKVWLTDANSFLSGHISGTPEVIVVEIYPLPSKEAELLNKAKTSSLNVNFITAIDSPFFRLFGGDRLPNLMKSLGMERGESIKHGMVNKAITRAQSKILEKVGVEKPEKESIEKWMEVNDVGQMK